MGIKCSLLGHRFGETTVERDREEEGTEVVITITEQETCTRCGETRVVSENKEVTTLESAGDDAAASPVTETSPSATGTDDEATAGADARGSGTEIPDAEGDPVTPDPGDASASDHDVQDDAEIIGDSTDVGALDDDSTDVGALDDDSTDDAGETADVGDAADEEQGPGEDTPDPAERAGEADEVEILDDGDGGRSAETDDPAPDAEAGPGGEAGVADAESGAGPDAAGSVADTTPGDWVAGDESDWDDSGVVGTDASAWPGESGDDTAGGTDAIGDWPEATRRDDDGDAEMVGPSLERDDTVAITVPEGLFKCPECSFTTEVESSSLRAGDFCPECHVGTLVQDSDADETDQ